MFWLTQTLVPIAFGIVAVFIVWIVFRSKTNRDNKNTEIVLKAIENNPDIDVDNMIKSLSKPRQTPMQLLHKRLLRGCLFTFIGLAFSMISAIMTFDVNSDVDDIYDLLVAASIFLSIGIAYLVVYFVSRKTVRKEEKQ